MRSDKNLNRQKGSFYKLGLRRISLQLKTTTCQPSASDTHSMKVPPNKHQRSRKINRWTNLSLKHQSTTSEENKSDNTFSLTEDEENM